MDEAKRLSEAQLEELQGKYGKIGCVEFSGHQIVFKKPTRDQCNNYRRMRESDAEKHMANELLAQAMIVAFDGETDANKARTIYTGTFLEDFPLFVSSGKAQSVIGALSGLVEDEDVLDLGKGALVRSARLQSMRAASLSGSEPSPEAKN